MISHRMIFIGILLTTLFLLQSCKDELSNSEVQKKINLHYPLEVWIMN